MIHLPVIQIARIEGKEIHLNLGIIGLTFPVSAITDRAAFVAYMLKEGYGIKKDDVKLDAVFEPRYVLKR